jgi:hypothetical protein
MGSVLTIPAGGRHVTILWPPRHGLVEDRTDRRYLLLVSIRRPLAWWPPLPTPPVEPPPSQDADPQHAIYPYNRYNPHSATNYSFPAVM